MRRPVIILALAGDFQFILSGCFAKIYIGKQNGLYSSAVWDTEAYIRCGTDRHKIPGHVWTDRLKNPGYVWTDHSQYMLQYPRQLMNANHFFSRSKS